MNVSCNGSRIDEKNVAEMEAGNSMKLLFYFAIFFCLELSATNCPGTRFTSYMYHLRLLVLLCELIFITAYTCNSTLFYSVFTEYPGAVVLEGY